MPDLVGKTLGQYRIVAKLDAKGATEIYKAHQAGLGRDVAIKVAHSHLNADPDFMARFDREALIIGKLDHPNIVRALAFDQHEDIHFIVMQLVEGPTLKEEFKARRQQGKGFSLADIGRIYLTLGEVLDYIHAQDIVHRNLKPANIIINNEGQILVTGFGLARLSGGARLATGKGAVMGTPAYMSPEQGLGDPVDRRTDIYSLGIILYELVTGRVPYKASTPVATIMKHLTEPLPSPRQVNPALPEAVEAVIVKALARAADARYQSAGALALALQEAIGLQAGDTLRQHPLKRVAVAASPDS